MVWLTVRLRTEHLIIGKRDTLTFIILKVHFTLSLCSDNVEMMSLTCAQIIFFIKIFTFKCWTIVSHENIWNAMTAILAFILIFLSCYGVWLYWKFKEKVCTNLVVISIVTLKCMRKFNASITSKFVWISRFSLQIDIEMTVLLSLIENACILRLFF